jgi:Cytochrome c554 and c-prime
VRESLKILIVLLAAAVAGSCADTMDLDAFTKPRYEAGRQRGAQLCASCHEDIYNQWSQHSRHSQATKSPSFRRAVEDLKSNVFLAGLVKESMCYSCHGSKTRDQGVNCETCHGRPLPGVPIETTHEKKYTPRLTKMRKPGFCAKCHEVKTPITGDSFTSVHSEWKKSEAAARGLTCQRCHMAKRADDDYAYHGFDSGARNVDIYKGDLRISNIVFDQPGLRLTLENRIKGHAIPASGPTRVLALELALQDANGEVLHRQHKRFFKRFSMLPVVGGVPLWLTDNSQLASGEKRRLRFSLPEYELAKSDKLVIVLRMYEVDDQHQGDISKAHWKSKPIVRRVLETK